MENDTQNVNPICPVCAGQRSSLLTVKHGYPVQRCAACAVYYIWPMPAVTEAVYDVSYFMGAGNGYGYSDYDEDKAAMTETFHAYLARIEAVVARTPGALYDIGAATGAFLHIAKQRRWQVSGVEISPYAAEIARSRGLAVATGTFDAQSVTSASFDCITMWDVLEHVQDPAALLSKAYAALRPGGVLALTTPDTRSAMARILRGKWHLVVPPEHLVLFNKENASALLRRTGFEVLHAGTAPAKRFRVRYIFLTAARWLSVAPFGSLFDWLSRTSIGTWVIPLNLRDNMFILARKPYASSPSNQ